MKIPSFLINFFIHICSADDIVIRLRGPLLSLPYLIQNGFNYPILVDSKVGLGIQMPSDSFTVSDVMDYVGKNRKLLISICSLLELCFFTLKHLCCVFIILNLENLLKDLKLLNINFWIICRAVWCKKE